MYIKSFFLQDQTLQLVIKTMRKGQITARQSMQFINEINFYSNIVPAIKRFEESVNMPEKEKIDAFPRYFGSRLSLDAEIERADTNAVMLLENLKSLNYSSPNRWQRLDGDEVLASLKVKKSF